MWRISITIEIIYVLMKAVKTRRSKIEGAISLPPVSTHTKINDKMSNKIVKWFDSILSIILIKMDHLCFYRSYGLATILRKRGVPVVMNIGGRSLSSPENMKAHSWLTLFGQPFQEKPNSIQLYPHNMGFNKDRAVNYWIGPEFDRKVLDNEEIKRKKSIKPIINLLKK
ncbi:MAG: lasso peptide biosynthesis protein [Thermodesulfobacteriota bacterium]|nr:lasso peptide biosynthesis protein [Thermodesulfobacteriota bacterium]